MGANGQEIVNQAKAGTLSLSELETTFSSESNGVVTISDWGVCYNSGTGQLSEYASVASVNSGNPITGIGMLAYSSTGSQLYAAQYTNDFTSPTIATSIGTTLFNPNDGNQVLCVVYGWTEQSSFYLTQTITIVPCV